MDTLRQQFEIKLKSISLKYVREAYDEIDWKDRLIGILGARGVGKTTLICQRILQAFPDRSKTLYVSLDNIWFGNHTLVELAHQAYSQGVTHLFLDEVHKYPGWQQQIKNIYDIYGSLNIVFTGSSLIEIESAIADLSRRCTSYDLYPLSFREYLRLKGHDFPAITLTDILYDHVRLSSTIAAQIDVLRLFKKYLSHGNYPFFLDTSDKSFLIKVANTVTAVIENDIPAVENVEYITLVRCKQALGILASQSPSPVNVSAMSTLMGITSSQLLKILILLERARILKLLYYKTEKDSKSLRKPQKILFGNTSILYALENPDMGKIRETFVASMLSPGYRIGYPKKGDLLVENRYVFEIGGHGKKFSQIADIPDSFLVLDGMESGYGNKIPMWLFGFLY